MEKCEGEKLASHHKSAWFSFIKSIATFKGDLSSLTAPPFLLSPQSITEYSSYWAENPSLFVAPSLIPDPEKRALAVLKWFLSTLKQQHSNKDQDGKKKKMKPLNPFLGEIFEGRWVDDAGTTEMVSEQVSHHPPATAFCLWNSDHGIQLQGHIAPKVYFSNTVHIDRHGYGLLTLSKYSETHLVTMPKVHIEGLMTGSLSPELSGTSYIRSSSGYTTKIEYFNRGWLSGKRNAFVATISHDDNADEAIYIVDGMWNDIYTVKDGKTKKVLEVLDMGSLTPTPLTTTPVENQQPFESRRAWKPVVDAINKGDMFAIGQAKSKIENEQRELRKREKAEGREFQRRYFRKGERDERAEQLAEGLRVKDGKGTSMKGQMDPHRMVWLWDEEKYRKAKECEKIMKRGSVASASTSGMKSPTHARFDSAIGGMDMDIDMEKDMSNLSLVNSSERSAQMV